MGSLLRIHNNSRSEFDLVKCGKRQKTCAEKATSVMDYIRQIMKGIEDDKDKVNKFKMNKSMNINQASFNS